MRRINLERQSERSIDEVISDFEAGEDPRVAMALLNRQIVDFQSSGRDVPARLLRLSKALTHECIAQSQGR